MRTGISELSTAAVFLGILLLCGAASAEDPPAQPSIRDQAWTVLHDGLHDRKATHRVLAVQALSLIPHNHRATQLAEGALKDLDRRVRAAAATSLGQMHASGSAALLKQALDDPETSVMLAAAYSLLLLKDPSAYEIYYAILMGDKKTSSGLVKSQLDRLRDPKQVAQMGFEEGIGFVPYAGIGYGAYREIRNRDHSSVRSLAARALAHDPDEVSQDALIQSALADKNEAVRLAALDALAERGDPAYIERLRQNLSEEKLAVRYRTAAVILHLGDRPAAKGHKAEPSASVPPK